MDNNIYCCKLTDKSELPEAASELLASLGLQSSSWRDVEENTFLHTVYCKDKQDAEKTLKALKEKIEEWKLFGVDLSDLELFDIPKEDWCEVWKRHFKIIHISDRLAIKPSWLELEPRQGRIAIELDPGMSFGTGHHPTTNFCLKMLDKLAKSGKEKSFLDAGCGSGILSIAALKLGYSPVVAFDIDPDATKVAEENFKNNGIAEGDIDLQTVPLDEFSSAAKYDFIAANILSNVLVKNRDRLLALLKPDAKLMLAGILSKEYEKIRDYFCEGGLKEESNFTDKEWTSGLFSRI